MKRRADVVDLANERASRRPACLQFTLTASDAWNSPGKGVFLWEWSTLGNTGEWQPSDAQFARQLRRIADRFDPRPVVPTRRRHRVTRSRGPTHRR